MQQFFTLVTTTPNRTTRTFGPLSNKRNGAVEAFKTLTAGYPGPQVDKAEATALLMPLVDAELGTEVCHEPTGYRFKIIEHHN